MILMGWVNYYGNFFMAESVCPTGKKKIPNIFSQFTLLSDCKCINTQTIDLTGFHGHLCIQQLLKSQYLVHMHFNTL